MRIGLLGCGQVGGELARILLEEREMIRAKTGVDIELHRILVRDLDRERPVPKDLLTVDPADAIDAPEIDIVVELLGGIEPAGSLVERAIAAGKPVVTANKALLAERGESILAEAARRGVAVGFEASVCAGIPVLRALAGGLAADRVEDIFGIVNGTSNYLLTRVGEGLRFEEALRQAQKLGFAEADPTLDLSGMDAAQKLAVLAMLAFGIRIPVETIPVQGIEGIGPEEMALARRLGYVLKPLVWTTCRDGGIELGVGPALVPLRHPLAPIRDEYNGLLIRGAGVGELAFSGRGAGPRPTATAVLADIVAVARGGLPLPPHRTGPVDLPRVCYPRRHLVRWKTPSRAGVQGLVTILPEEGIPVERIWSDAAADRKGLARALVLTSPCRKPDLERALERGGCTGSDRMILPLFESGMP